MTDEELMEIARPLAADGGRWPSDWITAMRAAMRAEREACANQAELEADAAQYNGVEEACMRIAEAIRMRSNA